MLSVFVSLGRAIRTGRTSRAQGFHVNLHQDLNIKYQYLLLKLLNVNQMFEEITRYSQHLRFKHGASFSCGLLPSRLGR